MRRFPFFKALLIALLVVLGTWGLIEMAASRAESRLEIRFSALADGLSMKEAYPPTRQNRTVEVLQEIGTSLGILMVTGEKEGARFPDDETAASWSETQSAIRTFLLDVRRQGADPLPPTNPDLESFLVREAATLDRLRTVLRMEEEPVWFMDLSEGFAARIPNYLGLLALQRLLIFDALESLRRGDEDLSMESLEASWRFNMAVFDHPYLISQLIAAAVLNEQALVMLRMHSMSPLWHKRLRELGPQSGMRRGFELEAWVAYASARKGGLDMGLDRQWPRIAAPYLRWAFYDHAERMLALVDHLSSGRQSPSDFDRVFEEHQADVPRWNKLGQLLMPNFSNAWVRAARAELALDLVERVAGLRDAIASGKLESIPARQASVMGDFSWEVESTATAIEIRLDGDFEAMQENPLPLFYRLSLSGTEDSAKEVLE